MWKGTYEATKAAESRTVLFQGAIEGFTERPIWGHGTGAWAMKEAGVDKRLYPHNIILELLYENGLIGATVLTLFFWLVFVRWRRASKLVQLYELDTEIFQIVQMEFLLFIFAFLQSMKSGDIDSNRPMFVYAGLIVVTSSMVRRIVENIDLSNEFLIMEQPVLSSEAVFDGTVFDSRQCE
jgi:O-antigen ligase